MLMITGSSLEIMIQGYGLVTLRNHKNTHDFAYSDTINKMSGIKSGMCKYAYHHIKLDASTYITGYAQCYDKDYEIPYFLVHDGEGVDPDRESVFDVQEVLFGC